MSSPTQTAMSFSFTFEIAGEPVPLTSQEITTAISKIKESPSPLDALIKKGVSFSTPGGWQLDIALSHLDDWLQGQGFSLPQGISDYLDETLITINHVMVNSNGSFSFAMTVTFDPPLAESLTKGVFAIENVGLAISHQTPPAS